MRAAPTGFFSGNLTLLRGFAFAAHTLVLGAIFLAFPNTKVVAQQVSGTATKNARWNSDAIAKAPQKARLRKNPMTQDPQAILAGGKLFQQHCTECHGRKAEGGNRGPSLLRDEVQNATPGTLFWILTNGVVWHGMPVWSKLPELERWQIVSFLKSFQTRQSP